MAKLYFFDACSGGNIYLLSPLASMALMISMLSR